MDGDSRCPVMGGHHAHKASAATSNQHWWPNQLNLKVLQQNSPQADPMGKGFNFELGSVLESQVFVPGS